MIKQLMKDTLYNKRAFQNQKALLICRIILELNRLIDRVLPAEYVHSLTQMFQNIIKISLSEIDLIL